MKRIYSLMQSYENPQMNSFQNEHLIIIKPLAENI